jgi:hypothetical protein
VHAVKALVSTATTPQLALASDRRRDDNGWSLPPALPVTAVLAVGTGFAIRRRRTR